MTLLRNRAHCAILTTIVSVLMLTAPAMAHAAAGDLDASFGTAGKVTTNIQAGGIDRPLGIAVQSDGKIVVAMESPSLTQVHVARYTKDGAPDTGFAGDGVADITVPNLAAAGQTIAVGSDGGIYVAARTTPNGGDASIAKLTASGALDTTWGSGGDGILEFGHATATEWVHDLAIDGAGRVVAVGSMDNGSPAMSVWRLQTDGTALDGTFSSTGVSIGYTDSYNRSVAIDSQNRIITAFNEDVGGGNYDAAITRFDALGGAQDVAFNGGIAQYRADAGNEEPGAVAVDGSDRVMLFSYVGDGSVQLLRYTTGGALDTSFPGSGIVNVALPGSTNTMVHDLVRASDGSFFGSFQDTAGGVQRMGVVKFAPTGSVETSWGGGDGVVAFNREETGTLHGDWLAPTSDGSVLLASETGASPERATTVHKILDRYADLDVAILPKPIAVDDLGTISFLLTNNGPRDVAPITLEIAMPPTSMSTIQSVATDAGTCTKTSTTVSCTLTGLSGLGGQALVAVRSQVRTIGSPQITAVATSSLADPTPARATATLEYFRRGETSVAARPVNAKGKTLRCGTRTSRTCRLGRTKRDMAYVAGTIRPLRTTSTERTLIVRLQINTGGQKWKTVREVSGGISTKGNYLVRIKGRGLKPGLYRFQTRVPQAARYSAGVSRLIYYRVR